MLEEEDGVELLCKCLEETLILIQIRETNKIIIEMKKKRDVINSDVLVTERALIQVKKNKTRLTTKLRQLSESNATLAKEGEQLRIKSEQLRIKIEEDRKRLEQLDDCYGNEYLK